MIRYLCVIFAPAYTMFAGGGATGGATTESTCFWTLLPMCNPSDQLPVNPCAKIETRTDSSATVRFLRKESDVKTRDVDEETGQTPQRQYCCEKTNFWHNLDVWMKMNLYMDATKAKIICEDQLVENQAFASRKIADLNKQQFMGMCVWLVEKKKSTKHEAERMRKLMLANGDGSVCPVRFAMMTPKIDEERVGVCHYLLFYQPFRLFGSHKDVCGEAYTELAKRHVKNSGGTLQQPGQSNGPTDGTTPVVSNKCIYSKLSECDEDIPGLPCWINPKAWPQKYKSPKLQEKIRATKFMKEKLEYREKNADNDMCCLRTTFWEILAKLATTSLYINSKYREPCIDILKTDQAQRPIEDFASAEFYSFCVVVYEMNESTRQKARFLGELLRLRYDRTCSMWHFTNDIPNERALCEFVTIKYHQADSDNHWTKTHGDECKIKEPETSGQVDADPEKGVTAQPDQQGGGFWGALQGLLPPGLAPVDPSNPNQPNQQQHGHPNQPHRQHHGSPQRYDQQTLHHHQQAPQQHQQNQPLNFNQPRLHRQNPHHQQKRHYQQPNKRHHGHYRPPVHGQQGPNHGHQGPNQQFANNHPHNPHFAQQHNNPHSPIHRAHQHNNHPGHHQQVNVVANKGFKKARKVFGDENIEVWKQD